MPDIDTDFDDDGRQKVIDYVVEKYGKKSGGATDHLRTMAAKSSIKGCGACAEYVGGGINALSKFVPERPGISLNRLVMLRWPAKAVWPIKKISLRRDGQC